MSKLDELSDEDRWAIVALSKHAGWSQEKIAKSVKCNQSTVSRILDKHRSKKKVEDLPRSGRKPLLDVTNTNNNPITNAIKNRKYSNKDIRNQIEEDYSIRISCDTVERLRRRLGFRPVHFRLRPKLTKEQEEKRMLYCLDNLDEDWMNIIFTDESWFSLGKNNQVIWKRPHDPPIELPTTKHPSKVMVWAGIWWEGKTDLCILDQRVDSAKYQSVLMKYVVRKHLNEDDKELLQDGAPAHVSRATLEFCDEMDITIRQNPPCSPELNPIEKLWNWMKEEVNKINISNIEQLVTVLQEVYASIPQKIIHGFISHNTTVVNEIVSNHGGTTPEYNRYGKKYNRKV